MTKVKICGITNGNDAHYAVSVGADFLGFIFYPKSPRAVEPALAKEIIAKLPASVLKVGVFVNEDPETVKKIAGDCGLDLLQFHGDESPDYIKKFSGYKIIKAIRVQKAFEPQDLKKYMSDFLLFDTFNKDVFGGTGAIFDWAVLEVVKTLKIPFFVSGGLTANNVAGLVEKVQPFAVDVSSGVESSPGKKDHILVKKFIHAAKGA